MSRGAIAVGALAIVAGGSFAQAPVTFTARLSWVPVSAGELADVGGRGAATAALAGDTLSISGAFDGLPARVTRASLRSGVATGAGGPVVAELDAAGGVDGTLSGEVALDRDALTALRAGRLYIQVHAEHGVPPDDAVLRGWLLARRPPAGTR